MTYAHPDKRWCSTTPTDPRDFRLPGPGNEAYTLRIAGQPDLVLPSVLTEPVTYKEELPADGMVQQGDLLAVWPIAASQQPPLGAKLIDAGRYVVDHLDGAAEGPGQHVGVHGAEPGRGLRAGQLCHGPEGPVHEESGRGGDCHLDADRAGRLRPASSRKARTRRFSRMPNGRGPSSRWCLSQTCSTGRATRWN